MRGTAITIEHLEDAAIEANLVQVEIGNNQPNLWRSEVYDITLTAGDAEYDLPARMIAVQDCYITTTPSGSGSSASTDRVIFPMTLTQYDAQPNKTIQAAPTAYLIQKTLSPTITFWQVPDDTATYVAHVRILARQEDVSLKSGYTLDVPYTYLDVFVAGLAHRLSRIYASDKEAMRLADYERALAAAQRTDTQDNTTMTIGIGRQGYFR